MQTGRSCFARILPFALFCLCAGSLAPAYAQRLRFLSSGVAHPDGGAFGWYSAEADPDNASNLISCGMKWDAKDNALYGFVSFSPDAGKSWHVALEDKSSKWVSEESCAFGVHGVAYFVADASKTDSVGDLHHEQGTTRIWVSRDSGETWSLATTAGWTDCSSPIVDRNPGPNQNRLYIFFNSVWSYYASIDDRQALQRLQNQFSGGNIINQLSGLISYKDGDSAVAGPVFDPGMPIQEYHGAYTSQNLILKNGSLLTLFWSKGSKKIGRAFILAAQNSDPKREKLSAPSVIYSSFQMHEGSANTCNSFLSTPAVYDRSKNTVYATYLDNRNGICTLMLTSSSDDGATWSAGHAWKEKQDADTKAGGAGVKPGYRSLALAINQEGVIALLWRDSQTSNCWYFASSTDEGQTYSHPTKISACVTEADWKYHLSDADLGSHIEQAQKSNETDYAELDVSNHYNDGNSHVSGIAVSPDGIFHPVWVSSKDGRGQLCTAAIAVITTPDGDRPKTPRKGGWRYSTNSVDFLYGGSQGYDEKADALIESVILLNSGTESLRGPLCLEINPYSQAGIIYPMGVVTQASGQDIAQYLDVTQYIPGDGLPPGSSSAPIPLQFHFELRSDAQPTDAVANISLRLLTKAAK